MKIKNAIVAKALNARNAKFKVGDKVTYKGKTGKTVKAVVAAELLTPGYVLVKAEDGTKLPMPEKLLATQVANAVQNAGVRGGNFQVVIETVDFSGNRTQTKNMTPAQLQAWLKLIHHDGMYDSIVDRFQRGERRYLLNLDMHPTVTITPM